MPGGSILAREPRYEVAIRRPPWATTDRSVTAGVFAVGILFGLERKHLSTTASIITHATYNTLAILAGQAADDEATAAIEFIYHAVHWVV